MHVKQVPKRTSNGIISVQSCFGGVFRPFGHFSGRYQKSDGTLDRARRIVFGTAIEHWKHVSNRIGDGFAALCTKYISKKMSIRSFLRQ